MNQPQAAPRHRTAALAALVLILAAAAQAYETRHVIIAVMDGVRYSETFGDPQRGLIPNLAGLAKTGALYTQFRNEGVTITRQGHSTLASGTWQVVPNGGPRLTRPTLAEYARSELGWPASACWTIFGKGPYSFAAHSSFPPYGQPFASSVAIGIGEGEPADDDKVLAEICRVIDADKPRLVFANFGVTDHLGHRDWDGYTNAIRHCDAVFGKLWAKVQATPGYQDKTTVFFTNDHGRHSDKAGQPHNGFTGHGDGCEGCRHIMLLAVGPDVKRGALIERKALEVDLAPTAGELLGFQTPFAEGEVLADCLVKPEGLNRKEARTPQAKEGARLLALAGRDVLRALADANLQRPETDLAPSDGTEVLMRGMLAAATATGDARYRGRVETWLHARAAEETNDAHVVRLRAALAASGPAPYPSPDALLRELAGRTEGDLVREWQQHPVAPPPMACEDRGKSRPAPAAATVADALRLVALADAAHAAPTDRIARLACDLHSTQCVRGLSEIGGLWPDDAVSALVLAETLRLQRLRQQHPIAWTPAASAPQANARPKRAAGGPAWASPGQFYSGSFPFSVDLLRFKVNEAGHLGDGSPLADGAALLLFSRAQAAPMKAPVGPSRVDWQKEAPPAPKGCTRIVFEFGGGDETTWTGSVGVEKGRLVAVWPHLFERNDRLDAQTHAFTCHTKGKADGILADVEGTDDTAVGLTAEPKGLTVTLRDLRAKRTIEEQAPGGNFLRATLGK